MPQRQPGAPAHLRYFAVLGLTALIGYKLLTFLTADIIATQAARPDGAREFSRVEMIMRARDAAYVQLPIQPTVLPVHVDEPRLMASNLASEIDLAETSDTPEPDLQRTSASAQQVATVPAAPRQAAIKIAIGHTARRKSGGTKIAAQHQPDLKPSRSPIPELQVATRSSLKGALQAEARTKPELSSKKLARRTPNAGELVMMQLLNQI